MWKGSNDGGPVRPCQPYAFLAVPAAEMLIWRHPHDCGEGPDSERVIFRRVRHLGRGSIKESSEECRFVY